MPQHYNAAEKTVMLLEFTIQKFKEAEFLIRTDNSQPLRGKELSF